PRPSAALRWYTWLAILTIMRKSGPQGWQIIEMSGGDNMPEMTLADAEKALAAAKAKAMEMGVKLSISVVDARGDLKCMVRMDGAPWRTPYVSRGKARASACWGLPSDDLTDRAMQPVFRAVMEVERGEFIPGQGALPIVRNGELIGAIGGSGGTSQEDEDAARAGVEAIT
ncbi:MAG: heme-binding protein, partial [Dehalococcoidia bacterium]